jgi:3-deoxy-D-manno-octulosonic-acid transferase
MDNIGMLSRLYHYATIAYVGGGFGVGIHNTLEAAVHGKPVLFGPQHQKFREALELIDCGGGIGIQQIEDILPSIRNLLNNEAQLLKSSQAAVRYVWENSGATATILEYIQVNRLLTS